MRANCRVFGITAQFIQQIVLYYLLLRFYMVCRPKLNREYPKMHSLSPTMILDQNDLENSFQGHNLNCAVLRANETL